jgi:hypothetical protein
MDKKFYGLLVTLFVFGAIFASASYSMTKTDKLPSFGCDAKSVIVQKNAKNLIIKWQYDSRLEGTQVKINILRNGKLLRSIAENVSIGKNGLGSWQGTWDDFFYTSPAPAGKLSAKGFSSPDWWVSNVDDPALIRGKSGLNKGYQIEIVSLANSKLRVMGDNASWDWGN